MTQTANIATNTAAIGTMASLATSAQGSLVAAVNEVHAQVDVLDGEIGDLTTLGTTPKTSVVAALGTAAPTTSAKTVIGAINEMDAEIAVNTAAIGDLSTLGGGISSMIAHW